MKTLVTLCLLLGLVSELSLASGRTVGNGGNVVICEYDSVKSYEVLDFYEARVLRGVEIDFSSSADNLESQIQFLLKRLEGVSRTRAHLYQKYFRSFMSEVVWLKEGELNEISDSDHITKPPAGCIVKQTVNQSNPILPNDKRYIIDQKIWDQMNNTQKVGLIMHEIIYREAISLGHTNSVSTRYLNSIICSDVMNTMSELGFAQILQDLGFGSSNVQGVEIDLGKKFDNYPGGHLKRASVREGSEYTLLNQQIFVRDEISFYENGQVEKLVLAIPTKIKIQNLSLDLYPYALSFYENGKLKSCTLSTETLIETDQYRLLLNGVIEFFDNGYLRIGQAVRGQIRLPDVFTPSVVDVQGPVLFYLSGSPQELTTQTHLTYVGLKSPLEISGRLSFSSEMGLQKMLIVQQQKIFIQQKWVEVAAYTNVFLSDKQVVGFTLAQDAVLMVSNHKSQRFSAGSQLQLDQEGFVKVYSFS